MKPPRRWEQLSSLALLLGIGGYFAFVTLRPVDGLPRPVRESVPGASFATESDSRILSEWMELKDSALIFLPHGRTSGVANTPATQPATLQLDAFPPVTQVNDPWPRDREANGSVYGSVDSASPKSLHLATESSPFSTFGQGEWPSKVLEIPSGGLLVTAFGKRKPSHALPLPSGFRERFGEHLWSPATFVFSFRDLGFAGSPIPASSSGVEKIDEALLDILLGAEASLALPDGHYRALASP